MLITAHCGIRILNGRARDDESIRPYPHTGWFVFWVGCSCPGLSVPGCPWDADGRYVRHESPGFGASLASLDCAPLRW